MMGTACPALAQLERRLGEAEQAMTAFALVVPDDAETALLAFEIGLALDAAQLRLARFSGLSVAAYRA